MLAQPMGALAAAPDLRPALLRACREGAGFVPSLIYPDACASLTEEVAGLGLEPAPEKIGPVRQQTETRDLPAPLRDLPLLESLRRDLAEAVRRDGREIRGLATWRPNDVAIQRYRPGAIGITPHLDGRRFRRLVAVVTLAGAARFAICRDRGGKEVAGWEASPGDLVLLRGPGLCGHRDGRPFHTVGGPRGGARLSVGFRMNARR
jgi:hypothetical protein